MKKAMLYVHGKGGSFREAAQFPQTCAGYDVIGVDYEIDFLWVVKDVIKAAYDNAAENYAAVSVIANSIGAFFTMLTLQDCAIEQALFISPIVDMEKLIYDMMSWAGVTEAQLSIEKEIATDFGEVLSWDYLQYVKTHPISWRVPTHILYGGQDNLTARDTIEAFAAKHNAPLTVMEDGEHWFHTKEQVAFLNSWMKDALR